MLPWGESSSGTAAPVAFTLSIIKLAVPPQALPLTSCSATVTTHRQMLSVACLLQTWGDMCQYTPYMRAAADPSPVFCEPQYAMSSNHCPVCPFQYYWYLEVQVQFAPVCWHRSIPIRLNRAGSSCAPC